MNNGSSVNTILLVVILVALVGGGVYWYTTYGPGMMPEETNEAGLEINLTGGGNE